MVWKDHLLQVLAHSIISSFTNISSLANLLIEIISINSLIYLIIEYINN
jgi:hypothetical protein